MRFLISVILSFLASIALAGAPGINVADDAEDDTWDNTWDDTTQPQSPPAKITKLTPEMKANILAAMRLNRRAFQAPAILERYGEKRPPADHAAFASCDLPRTSTGEPAAQYPAAKARSTARTYGEAAVIDCLETTGGLAGTRAKPLTQHYYCSLPGLSPDIRACFTFQLRLPKVSTKRDITDEHGYMPDGKRVTLLKAWNFLGPDPDKVPDVGEAFKYCATDGRPHAITRQKTKLDVKRIHPTPTRPTCWIAQTQLELFQGIMGGVIDPPVKEQVALLREYYECDKIKGKVSAQRFKTLCQIDVKEFQ